MSVFVVDGSVAVKWMLPEPLSAQATRLQSPSHQLHAPSFFEIELANVLWKKIRQGLPDRAQADFFLNQLPGLPLTRHTDTSLVSAAFDIAERAGRTVYDCMYATLAVRLGGKMVTAGDRLVNSLAATPWAVFVSGRRPTRCFVRRQLARLTAWPSENGKTDILGFFYVRKAEISRA